MSITASFQAQPGTPEQLQRAVEKAEQYYERSRVGVVVYWDDAVQRYQIGNQATYNDTGARIDVVWIPWKIEGM